MFLSRDEIAELTGYKNKASQKRWLTKNGYKFSVRRDGYPCVLLSHVENVLGGASTQRVKQEVPDAKALLAVIND